MAVLFFFNSKIAKRDYTAFMDVNHPSSQYSYPIDIYIIMPNHKL